jgi:hypothetical protein
MTADYCYLYEDRDEVHTSRWSLSGVNSKAAGNILNGRLWAKFAYSSPNVTIKLYKTQACGGDDEVATGAGDVSGIADAAVKVALSTSNASGLTGELYLEDWTSAPSAGAELLVVLCDDGDLAIEYANCADLPAYDSTNGMAEYCIAATQKVLLQVSQVFREELGGYGAPEHRYRTGATRDHPRYDRLGNPDQLKEAAVHWALQLAFGRSHEMASETMYSELRDYHDRKCGEAIASWNLAINTDPDTDDDIDTAKSGGMVRIERV